MLKKAAEGSIPVFFLKEGEYYIAYTPAVDLSTAGKTFEEAKKRFHEAFSLFMEELVAAGTVDEVLQGYGWKRVHGRPVPPMYVGHSSESVKIPIGA